MARKPNRSTDTSILVRCTEAEKSAIERAAERAEEDLPGGARLPVYAFVLSAALDRAKALGFTPEEKRPRKDGGR